jgi:hypothetical protein
MKTDKQTDKKTDKQTDKERYQQIDIETNKQKDYFFFCQFPVLFYLKIQE